MVEVAKRYQDSLRRIKQNVEKSYNYFNVNYKRWHEFRKFIFLSNITPDEQTNLQRLGKPPIECNICEAYISRLRGEFSKQEPSITVMADYNNPVNSQLLNIVENNFRHAEYEARKDGVAWNIYTDLLSGGFSVGEVFTEYENPMSMNQVIKWRRVYDPTMCGFDPLAILPHKGDGRFCFKIYPKSDEDFKNEFEGVDISEIEFERLPEDNVKAAGTFGAFNWSYRNQNEKILLVVDYYEKKKKKTKVVELSTGQVITDKQYKSLLERWQSMGFVEQPPTIVSSRITNREIICRYRLIENQVIEYVETDFPGLPLVYAGGNPVVVRDNMNGIVQEHTRPYIYHAKGMQKAKNIALQSLVHEIENSMQHKIKVPLEGIPKDYADAYTNVVVANTLVYNQFKDNDPAVRLDPPQEIVRPPMPQEFMALFASADQAIQNILGSYDASLGINDNQLSGVAIVEAATQSNAAAMPYVVGYMQFLNRIAELYIQLMPKYYIKPRILPLLDKEGKSSYTEVNKEGSPEINYAENSMNIKVEAGVSFAIQKSRALQQISLLMQASPIFAQFINETGLPVLLDNMEIRGIDQLKDMANKFMQKLQQQAALQAKMAQQNMQNNPVVMKTQTEMAKIKQQQEEMQINASLKAAELANEQQANENDRLKILAEIDDSHRDQLVQMDKHQTEKTRAAVDMAIAVTDMRHRHSTERERLHHDRTRTLLDHIRHEEREAPSEEAAEHE